MEHEVTLSLFDMGVLITFGFLALVVLAMAAGVVVMLCWPDEPKRTDKKSRRLDTTRRGK